MERPGHLIMTLRSGEALGHVSNHLDCLLGAGRPASRLDDGALDQALRRWGGGFRASGVYHARGKLGRVGEQHVGYDDLEERLGLSRTYRVELADPSKPREAVHALRDIARVESAVVEQLTVVPSSVATPLDARPRRLTFKDALEPHERVHGPAALALEPGDERVVVAVIDSGVDLGHPELQRKVLAGYDLVDLGIGEAQDGLRLVGDSRGRDFCPRDEVCHGSQVAGIVAAQGWRVPRGLGGRALCLPIRVLAAAETGPRRKLVGVGAQDNISAGMKVAVDLGADVLQMSFGTAASSVDPYGPPPHADAVRYAAAYGCTLIAAIGNGGTQERYYPAALPEVIAVGSVDAAGRRSSFSTYGPHLALCAPGERIVSVAPRGYRVSSGTSFAAPFVSATAALLLARARRAGRALRGDDVRRLLIESVTPLGAGGFSPETGHGLLNAEAAIRRLDQALAGDHPPGGPR